MLSKMLTVRLTIALAVCMCWLASALAYSATVYRGGHGKLATADGKYYALCVGVGQFQNGRLGALNGTVPDAKNVLSACTDATHGLWLRNNCFLMTNSSAKVSSIRDTFHGLATRAKSGDTVLYYHSSHGGDDVICCYDADYHADDFADDLARFNAGVRVIMVIDTCGSGSMFKDGDSECLSGASWKFAASVEARLSAIRAEKAAKGVKDAGGPSIGWITACDEGQTSLDTGDGGWFTVPFVKAWKRNRSTDKNGDDYNDFLEIFNVAAPQATDEEREPQRLNDNVLSSVAAWSVKGTTHVNVVPTTWVEESAEMQQVTGTWSSPVAYDAYGRAFIDGDVGETLFTPSAASTGNVVTVETTMRIQGNASDYTPGQDVQLAVRFSTNGCFQVWTWKQFRVKSGGVGELGWVDVVAEGFAPVSGEEYTLRTIIDYTHGTYSVAIKDNDDWHSLDSHILNSQLPASSSFPLAFPTNCATSFGFAGDAYFTSLVGDCRYEIIGFEPDEALVLSNNVEIVLGKAKAEWLNTCGGGDRATVVSAATGLTETEFNDAYLLNLDIADGERSYTFDITDIDVGDTCVTVAVTLTRTGKIEQKINGTLKFYGAATLSDFKKAESPLGSAELSNDNFSNGDSATATIQLDGETPPAFFKAKIEE